MTKVSVRGDCFGGAIETIPWEQRKPYDEFDYGYVLDRAQVAGLAMGRRRAVRREALHSRISRARWLYTGITRARREWRSWE